MSGGEGRGLSGQDLHSVKNLIERCLQLHMSRKEVVSVLLREANVMPSVTELLWQRLEQENQEFFEEYYIRLALKEQIQRFNELLKQQAVLMGKIQSPGVVPNGSRVAPFQQNAGCYAMNQTGPSVRPERLQSPIAPTLPGSFTNSVSPLQRSTPFNLTATPRAIGCVPDTLHVQNSNSVRFMHGLNGGIIKTENGYPSNYTTFYGAEHNLDEGHGSIEDGSIATYVGMQANSQPLNETLLGVNGSYGQLEQIPKIFSLPDLAYTNVMENYPSAFMTEPENFLNSQDRGEIQDESKVAITDSYGNYEEFGSE